MTTTYTNQEILDAIRSAIHGTADREAQSTSINGRTVSSFSFTELIAAEKYFAGKVAKATSAGRTAVGRFRNAG